MAKDSEFVVFFIERTAKQFSDKKRFKFMLYYVVLCCIIIIGVISVFVKKIKMPSQNDYLVYLVEGYRDLNNIVKHRTLHAYGR
ncbi:MAG: hypothetical protein AB7V50_10540, partial [Vampirovibrionia bacterium]